MTIKNDSNNDFIKQIKNDLKNDIDPELDLGLFKFNFYQNGKEFTSKFFQNSLILLNILLDQNYLKILIQVNDNLNNYNYPLSIIINYPDTIPILNACISPDENSSVCLNDYKSFKQKNNMLT